jgi:predicted RNA-binding Zn-ribbon protein involved in translation (DUF1610 family)
MVIHEHFPTRYFKYILLGAALIVVIRVAVYLIESTTSPKLASLLKQYRDAYERFLCPICEYPIRRGPMKFSFWDRRTIRKREPVSVPVGFEEQPYACPACGTQLFDPCPRCNAHRPSLLPFCDYCGNERSVHQEGETVARLSFAADADLTR